MHCLFCARRRCFHSAFVLLCVAAAGLLPRATVAAAEPTTKTPPLRVEVDPRVELMSIIFRLAGNPEYNRGCVKAYAEDVETHFGPFRDSPVVKLAKRLRAERGVSYDACMNLAAHVSDAYTLKEKVPLDPHPETLDGRWSTLEAREFLVEARRFVKDASFQEFVEKHRPLYKLTQSRLQTLLEKRAHLEWFNEFFGQRPRATFVAVPALLNGPNNYGVRCPTASGMEELFCILGVWDADEQGMPEFDQSMIDTVVHEFCHSYANAVIDRHSAELEAAGAKIFPLVAKKMESQAYGHWTTMFYESLVRVCVLRYTQRYDGAPRAWVATQREELLGFAWMGALSDLLGEYEQHRDRYPSLEAFSGRLVEFFNEDAEKAASKQAALAEKRPKVVSTTPANGATDVSPSLDAIVVVFDRPMKKGSWSMCGGGPHFPETSGKPSYDAKQTTWTIHVKLKPGRSYEFMLNSPSFTAFQSEDGVPLEPVKVTFKTAEEKSTAPNP